MTNSAISMFNSLSSTSRMFNPLMDAVTSSCFSSSLATSSFILNGIVITKVVPTPCSLVKVIVPPIFSTRLFVIGIPRPVPPNLDAPPFCSCANGSNRCFWNSSLIPIPVSWHLNSKVTILSCSEEISLLLKYICP